MAVKAWHGMRQLAMLHLQSGNREREKGREREEEGSLLSHFFFYTIQGSSLGDGTAPHLQYIFLS